MARRIASTPPARATRAVCAAAIAALAAAGPAAAQDAPPLSKFCQPGAGVLEGASPLPNVAAALASHKILRILSMGAAPGRVSSRGGYTALIETMLENALRGIDVVMVNRGISGELAASAATRMKNEVALERPDLVLWQVGTNDALAYVGAAEFAATVKNQIKWLKDHNVDVILVGLQFAPRMQRDAHYVEIRGTLRKVAAEESVIVVRFFDAMQIIEQAIHEGPGPAPDEFESTQAGYNCLAQYIARAIALGAFAKGMPLRSRPK